MTDLAVGLHQFTLSLHVGVGKTNHRLKEILMGSALHPADTVFMHKMKATPIMLSTFIIGKDISDLSRVLL